jgi:hypothetical protein
MADPRVADPVESVIRELAEGLQATGLYLGAVRQALREGASSHLSQAEIVDRAFAQWLRTRRALRELRSCIAPDEREV